MKLSSDEFLERTEFWKQYLHNLVLDIKMRTISYYAVDYAICEKMYSIFRYLTSVMCGMTSAMGGMICCSGLKLSTEPRFR